MQLFFYQNCISPHQMPYIEALSEDVRVERVFVIVPRLTYDYRAKLGWPESWIHSTEKMQILLSPDEKEVRTQLSRSMERAAEKGGRVIALFSGISAFPEVKQWFRMSLSYIGLERGIITEAPFVKGKKWLSALHRIHFLLTDYRYIHKVDYVFAIGDDCVSYYASWSKKWNIVPFMYCTQSPNFDVPPVSSDDCLKVIFVGALEGRKNVGLLLEAFRNIAIPYQLTIVGDGLLRQQLELQARAWGISVQFVGSKNNSEIPSLMVENDLLVLPSWHDGWGAVVNEAAMVGTLTAVSRQCGARSIADYVFDANAAGQLRDIMLEIQKKMSELRAKRKERIQWADEHISSHAVASKMLEGLSFSCNKNQRM